MVRSLAVDGGGLLPGVEVLGGDEGRAYVDCVEDVLQGGTGGERERGEDGRNDGRAAGDRMAGVRVRGDGDREQGDAQEDMEDEDDEGDEVTVDGGLGVWNSSELEDGDEGTAFMLESDWVEKGTFMNFSGV